MLGLVPQSKVHASRALSTIASRHGTHAQGITGLLSQNPSVDELAPILRRSRKDRNATQVLQLCTHIQRYNLETDAVLGNLLVSALADVGCMRIAQQVFDAIVCADDSSWNSLILGYVKHGNFCRAFAVYQKMQKHDARHPSGCAFVALLKSCTVAKDVETGSALHAETVKRGLLKSNVFVGSALIDLYGKCGCLEKAREVFDKLSVRDVVSWTTLIGAYSEHGHGEEALACYEQMQYDGICLNAVTFICGLKACAHVRSIIKTRQVHSDTVVRGFETDLLVGSTLVDAYAKCASLDDAQKVFDKLPSQGVYSWTALISGYAEQGNGEKALRCMQLMQEEGVSPNAITLMCSLKACGNIGATCTGQQLHLETTRKGYEKDLLVCSTLVDMYANCGLPREAQDTFDKLLVRDVVAWNALMSGYALHGECEHIFSALDRMQGDEAKPNVASLVSVLTGCSHAGVVDKGYYCFGAIGRVLGLVPTIDHYTCMVDLLGRAGQLDAAVAMVKKMPLLPGTIAWRTIVGACRKWGDIELGRHAFEHTISMNATGPSVYVSMSNLYVESVEGGELVIPGEPP